MKQTFTFHRDLHGMTSSKMKTLYRAIHHRYSAVVDWGDGLDVPTKLAVSMEPREMDTIARFIGISSVALNGAVQRETGTPVSEVPLPERMADQIRELESMGCDLFVTRVGATSFQVAFPGFIELACSSEFYVCAFLNGVIRGLELSRGPKLTSALKTLRKPMAKVTITRRSKRSA